MTTHPDSPDGLLEQAHHHASNGKLEPALRCIDLALRLSPRSAVLHFNRGLLLRALGQNNDAILAQRKAWKLRPSWLEPLLALTELALETPTTYGKKISELEKALDTSTWNDNSRATFLRGRLAAQRGDLREAERLYRAASQQNPELTLTQQYLASLLLTQERWSEAEGILQQLLNQQPKRADILSNLSIALLRQNKLVQALTIAEKALAEVKGVEDRASVLVNLGSILQELGHRDNARQCYGEALALDPCQANALLNLGVLDFQQRDFEGAEWHYREALLLKPNDPRTEVNLAGLLLLQGRTQEGWQHYEARLGGNNELLHQPEGLPLWQGQALRGELLLVHEQGLGDTFQFIRYARLLQKQGISCQFQGPSKLHSLLLHSGLVSHCISDGEPVPTQVEAWIPMLSMPRLLPSGQTNHAYLRTNAGLLNTWQQQLGQARSLRLALHWQGQPEHEFTVSRGRSFALSTLEPLLSIPCVEWISLQKGPGSEQARQAPFAHSWHPQQALIDATWDFEDAAAILSCCDGLVSSDSGIAHLAGALGCRVWLMLPWLAEWRWGLESTSTPWYPNHTLLRQRNEGDWSHPVDQLIEKITALTQDCNPHLRHYFDEFSDLRSTEIRD
jgi:Flp pilus assembly protein TadD